LPKEELENDPSLIKEIGQLLNFKIGLDERSYSSLFASFAENRKNYMNIYKAIEEEVLNKNSLNSFKI
jgi:hypothetical protein